uniref:Uncharacterized protein n=1 Tax=Globodera rostochiensis TaxID=31243 RepID=A0A914HK64_GLORO
MNIYRNFALYLLIFQPVLVLSEGPKNVHFSLSQMSLFLNKMDEFLASKCIMNKSAFNKMRGGEVSKWEKELKQSVLKLKYPMEIDDQQQPSTMSAKAFMAMLLSKMWKKGSQVPKQNRLLLYDLVEISSNFAKQFLQIARNNNVLSKFGDNCSLINWPFYEELEWKLKKVADIMRKFHGSTSSFILYKYFNVNISWHEPDENITAWKMDVPMLNEQRFVQNFLLTFQTKEKSWEIVMPSAIEKMKAEIDEQIKSLNEKFTLPLNSVEQNRLFLLSMHKIALHFVQNLLVNGLLNDEERNKLVIDIKNKMYSIFEKDLKYFEGIEQYYYGIETGTKLKEWLGKFKNEQKNQNQLVSIEQIGLNDSILADFVKEKLADSIGDLLREGESLALLDWCHKNHRQISMTELAYIVEKLRELLFPDVPIMEWERERERTLRCGKHLWNLVDKMDELTNCSNRLDFTEFGRSFGTNRSFMLLVVNVLKCEEAANGADKWICPYNDHIFEQITDFEIKRLVLKGLLEFGRLFMETFGIFAMEIRCLRDWRTMIWKNISITFTSYDNLQDQMEAIKESLREAGLIEAMGDEIVENRDSLLAKAGVKRKNNSRLN